MNRYLKPSFWLTFWVCSFASSFYVYEYIIRVMPSAMAHELVSYFDLTAAGFGLLSSFYFWGYALMQIPAGLLFDRFSPRWTLAVMMGVCALATFAFAATHFFGLALTARLFMGITAASAYVGALVVGSHWFEARYYAAFAGIVQIFGCVGAIIGQTPVAWVVSKAGWQVTSFGVAVLGVLLAVGVALVVRDYPPGQALSHSPSETVERPKIWSRVTQIFKHVQTKWLVLYGFAIWGPIVGFTSLWSIPYIETAYQIDRVKAASFVMVIWIGVAIGGPLVGWWSNHVGLRRLPMKICAVMGCVVAILLIYFSPLPKVLLFACLFLFGVASSAQVLSFGLVSDLFPKHSVGVASGLANMAIIFGGVVFQPLLGLLLQHGMHLGHTEHALQLSQYSVSAYHKALFVIPLSYLLALVATLKLQETHCRPFSSTL